MVSKHDDLRTDGIPAATARRFVEHLDDLIQPEEYPDHADGRLVRVRITVTADGVRVDGDAFRPEVLERLLDELGPETVEQMLCG